MTFGLFETLPRFRAIGDSKFIASCPTAAHPRGDRHQSFSGKLVDRRILINCKVGCSAREILDAIGLGWDALFLDRGERLATAAAIRKQAARKGFRDWREKSTRTAGTELRNRDMVALAASTAVDYGVLTEDQFWEVLSGAYRGYLALEHRFEVLRTGTDSEALDLIDVTPEIVPPDS